MKSKSKNSRVPKSGKTKLSDLTPKKDARGGVQKYGGPPIGGGAGPGATPPGIFQTKKSSNRPLGGPANA
jgi:hypothetical protein